MGTSTEPLPALRNPEYLARAANRHRQKKRPAEPTSLDFDLSEDHIPEDFLKADVKVDGRRHLMFATENMVSLLKKSKTWYVDGTFKVVKAPFTQLFTIHSFVRSGECTKQIPLAFILMSGKRRQDYRKILKVVKESQATECTFRMHFGGQYTTCFPGCADPGVFIPLAQCTCLEKNPTDWPCPSIQECQRHSQVMSAVSGTSAFAERTYPTHVREPLHHY